MGNGLSAHDALNTVHKFGINDSVGTGAAEDLWIGNGTFATPSDWTPPTTARLHKLKSTLAGDTSAGTGARTVKIYGLDADWALASETITLNGLSDVTSTKQYNRLHRMAVITAGASDGNAGWITATAQTDNTIQAIIAPNYNQTLQAIFTTPANTVGLMHHFDVTAANSVGSAIFTGSLWMKSATSNVWQIKDQIYGYNQGNASLTSGYQIPLVVDAKTDIKIQITSTRAATTAAGSFEITLDGPGAEEIPV